MIINHNLNAMNAHRNMAMNNKSAASSMEKLSSGLRINRAGDDAAGLSISEKMRGQIRGLNQASTNAQDGISMIQTTEGALNEVHSIIQRMRELAVQASNDTNVDEDKAALNNEFTELVNEIGRIKDNTEFNTQKLLDATAGDGAGSVKFQVGANAGQTMELDFTTTGIDLTDVHTNLGNVDLTGDADTVSAFIEDINEELTNVSAGRSMLGAYQNRLEHTINNLDNASENLQSAESRIRDVDMASEMMTYSSKNILQQAAQSMLAQANSSQQGVLQLLQ